MGAHEQKRGTQMTSLAISIPDGHALWLFAKKNGRQAVADLLRAYVRNGEPDDFCPGYTTRAMCRIASNGIDGVSEVHNQRSYIETTHGVALYWYMWGLDPLPNAGGERNECPSPPICSAFVGKTVEDEEMGRGLIIDETKSCVGVRYDRERKVMRVHYIPKSELKANKENAGK